MPNDEVGPTWQDVYDYTHRLELFWGVVIDLHMRLHMQGKPERLVGTCTAEARTVEQPVTGRAWYGYHGFRGNGGAKTAPGAYWHALSDLEGKLAGVAKVAQHSLDFGG